MTRKSLPGTLWLSGCASGARTPVTYSTAHSRSDSEHLPGILGHLSFESKLQPMRPTTTYVPAPRWKVFVCLAAVLLIVLHASHSHSVLPTGNSASHCVVCLSVAGIQPAPMVTSAPVRFVRVATVRVPDRGHVTQPTVLSHAIRPPPSI
jgi:hypothetical protein